MTKEVEERAEKDLEVLTQYYRAKMQTEPDTTIGICQHIKTRAFDDGWAVNKLCLGCGHRWVSIRENGVKNDHDEY